MTTIDLESDTDLYNPQAAWDFIQQAILIEDHCDIDAKEWYLQHPDTDPVIVGVVEVLYVHRNTVVRAIVACDDGINRKCRVSHWKDSGSHWQPPDEGYDFEWIDK